MRLQKFITWTLLPLCIGAIAGCNLGIPQPQATIAAEPVNSTQGQNGYRWANVAIGGGGFVTGIYLHPQQPNLAYIKTDIGGFYRWNPQESLWIPLTDHFPHALRNYYGGEALALDPTDPDIVYIATGKYTGLEPKGTIFKSTDRGDTWQKLDIDLPMGGNQQERWAGERLAIAPDNPNASTPLRANAERSRRANIILFGSRQNGLWKSTDAGATWAKVNAFPATLTDNIGIVSIVFDPQSPGRVYANAYGDGIYQSFDAGKTWRKLTGSPTEAQRMAVASNGILYVTHKSGASKYGKGTWVDITPTDEPTFFNALAVNPRNPNDVIIASGQTVSTKLYRTQDGGANWTEKTATTQRTVSWRNPNAPWTIWTSALEFDPKVPGKVWLSDGFGVWQTENIDAEPALWTDTVRGLEEIVAFSLIAPPQGAILLSGVADVSGFAHDNGLNAYPSQNFNRNGPSYQHNLGLNYADSNPLHLVRVGGNTWNATYTGATSTDGGFTWTEFPDWQTDLMPLNVAISATDPNLFLVKISEGQPLRTTDGGATWSEITGLPDGPKGPWDWAIQLAADGVNGDVFYYYDRGKVFRSSDRGASFRLVNSSFPNNYAPCDPSQEGLCALKTIPGIGGEVWLSLGRNGLFRSTNGGETFTRIPAVKWAHLYALGKPPQGSKTPALYLYGEIEGQGEGIFRSLNRGQTWTNITSPENPIGSGPKVMTASWQQFGLVFIGTNGRGIFYGIPEE